MRNGDDDKTTLGIMAYPDLSRLEDIEAYMQTAASYGFKLVGSSMLSVDGDRQVIIDYFKTFIKTAHRYHMRVFLDVNPPFLARMQQSPQSIPLS